MVVNESVSSVTSQDAPQYLSSEEKENIIKALNIKTKQNQLKRDIVYDNC